MLLVLVNLLEGPDQAKLAESEGWAGMRKGKMVTETNGKSPSMTMLQKTVQGVFLPAPIANSIPKKRGQNARRAGHPLVESSIPDANQTGFQVSEAMLIVDTRDRVYKEHELVLHCDRCYAEFETETELTEHRRTDPPCPLTEHTADGLKLGYTDAMMIQLKSRRGVQKLSQEERWERMHRILFPNAQEIPSCCKTHTKLI
jgi:hypothetical protein